MKHIRVNIVTSTGPEGIISGMSKPYKNEKADMSLVKKVCLSERLTERHGSVLEHCVFTFEILGSSRLELQEHMRHRIASPTVESTRFCLDKVLNEICAGDVSKVDPAKFEEYFVVPDLSLPEFSEITEDQKKAFLEHYRYIALSSLESMAYLRQFESFNKKKHNDITKYLLNEGFRTNFTWTINLRSLINFLRLRNAPGAHFEIRWIAGLIIEALKSHWCWPVVEEGLSEL